jgi:hypothetical protein
MKLTGVSPEVFKREIAAVCGEVFFPEIDPASRFSLVKLPPGANPFEILSKAKVNGPATGNYYFSQVAGKARLLNHTITDFANGFDYWLGGMDDDALLAFPAMELTLIIREADDAESFPRRWRAADGRMFKDRMIAGNWDPVWSKISAFEFPFPPFQLKSGWGVRGVNYSEAKSFGIELPMNFSGSIELDVDKPAFRARLAKEFNRIQSSLH